MPRAKKIVATPDVPSVGTIVTTPPNRPSVPPTPPNAKLAYDRVVSEIEAVTEEEVKHINLDIAQAVILVLGAVPAIRAHRRELAQLYQFDIRNVTRLEDYALASFFTHTQALPSFSAQAHVRELIDEGVALRTMLLEDADLLVRRGVLEAQSVAAAKAGQGYADVAQSLVALGALFEGAWKTIAGRTFVTEAQVTRANALGSELLSALGTRASRNGNGNGHEKRVGDNRARAYTLFVRAYDEVRRGLTYLRWHEGDIEQIAPSLYSTRAGRSTSETEVEQENEAAAGQEDGAAAAPRTPPSVVEAGAPG